MTVDTFDFIFNTYMEVFKSGDQDDDEDEEDWGMDDTGNGDDDVYNAAEL